MRVSQFLKLSALCFVVVFAGGCISLSGGGDRTSGPAGMFVSTDKGESWRPASVYPTRDGVQDISGANVYRMIQDPQDSSALYWLTRGKGFFFSYDSGRTWQRPKAPMDTGFIYDLAVHPKDKCILFATNGRQVYKSTDCSRSWEEVYGEPRSGIAIISLAFHQFPPYEVYVAEAKGDVFRSVDAGESWHTVKRFRQNLKKIVGDPQQEGVMYVASTKNGLHRTTDGGVTWQSLKDSINKYSGGLEYRRFYLHPTKTKTLYWVSKYGILVSDDMGSNWNPMQLITPPGAAQIYGFAVDPKNDQEMYYTSTSNGRHTFFRTQDGGKNWKTERLPSGQVPTMVHAHPQENFVYVGFTVPPKQ